MCGGGSYRTHLCRLHKRNEGAKGDNDDHEVGESMKTELRLDDLQ